MPPSFGGTRRCARTRKPSASRRRRVEASRRRFWKLPPESTTVRGSHASAHAAAAPAATASWNAAAIRALEVRGGAAPRLADRSLAPRERHGIEVRDPLERREVAAQELPAPERSVGAVAGPVEDERERRALLPVLREAGRGMRVVVLD